MSNQPPSPMHAKAAGAVGVSTGGQRASTAEPTIPPDADPNSVSDEVLALLDQERFQAARRMAAEARERFPGHTRVQKIWGLFDNRGKAHVRPGNEPGSDEEFAWLTDPPKWARGKWVALVGSEAVAAADTLAEVLESLRTKKLAKRPLVHRIG